MKQAGFQADAPSHSYKADSMESGRGRETTPSKTRAGAYGRSPRRYSGPGLHPSAVAATVAGAVVLCCYLLFAGHNAFSILSLAPGLGMHGLHRFGDGTAQTLVIYVYAHTDVEYEDNLKYFLEFGVRPGDGCDYLVVVQQGKGVLDTQLPPLPDNVRAVEHVNECYDWGTFGWAIDNHMANTARYRYVIFLNSSVRGPFLPAYWPADLHWSRVLTDRISNEVKLVGATISCEGANKGGVLTGDMRRNPHVQSYVVATDQTGLALLQQDGRVLRCYSDIHDAIWYAELGSSAAILNAGYNIDALMLRYQGVDWRNRDNWECNAGINPYAEHMYDGIDVSPFEVMFVKVKEFLLEANWTTATAAKKYSSWARGQGGIATNEYNQHKSELRAMKVLRMRARGSACFDFDFYRVHNPDLPPWGRASVWEHFVLHGQHEGRVFRFRCKSGQIEGTLDAPVFKQVPGVQQAPQRESGKQQHQQQQHPSADAAALEMHALAADALAAAAAKQLAPAREASEQQDAADDNAAAQLEEAAALAIQQLQRAQQVVAAGGSTPDQPS